MNQNAAIATLNRLAVHLRNQAAATCEEFPETLPMFDKLFTNVEQLKRIIGRIEKANWEKATKSAEKVNDIQLRFL